MWKSDKPSPANSSQPTPSGAVSAVQPTPDSGLPLRDTRRVETAKPAESFRADVGHIGKSVMVKGELSGSEDLYLDGEVEGSINLRDHSLTIGPNGRIRATIHARELIVHGKIDGNVEGTERVELKKSSSLVGDVLSQRIVIEDGAFFKGSINTPKEAKTEPRKANGVGLLPVHYPETSLVERT